MSTNRPRDLYYSASGPSPSTRDRSIERDRIALETAAFTQSGGLIEVLGITPLRRKTDERNRVAVGAALAARIG